MSARCNAPIVDRQYHESINYFHDLELHTQKSINNKQTFPETPQKWHSTSLNLPVDINNSHNDLLKLLIVREKIITIALKSLIR